jgi:OOP family OmpA-OmpF porin
MKMIAEALAKQPALKLRIEGHTDSTGDVARNLELSNRRAEAVRARSCRSTASSAERLSDGGLGQTRPVSTNDTPQGRADNRRAEFVKM